MDRMEGMGATTNYETQSLSELSLNYLPKSNRLRVSFSIEREQYDQ